MVYIIVINFKKLLSSGLGVCFVFGDNSVNKILLLIYKVKLMMMVLLMYFFNIKNVKIVMIIGK